MKAIIHCAGKGTRLPDISSKIPKPMVEINGKPLLLLHIQQLKEAGVKDICITVHHLSRIIMDYFGDGRRYGLNITYSHEAKLLGTGGALEPLMEFLDDNTLIIYGDVVSFVNYKKMLRFHLKHNGIITAAVHPSTHPEDSDLIEFDNNNELRSILIKPHKIIPQRPFNLSALYIVNPAIKNYLNLTKPYDIAHDLLPHLLGRRGKIFCYNTSEFMMDIGTPDRLRKVHELLKK